MFKLRHRLFALALCMLMIFSMSGFTMADAVEDHDGHEHEYTYGEGELTALIAGYRSSIVLYADEDGSDQPTGAPETEPTAAPTEPPATPAPTEAPTQPPAVDPTEAPANPTPAPTATAAPSTGKECPGSPNGQHEFSKQIPVSGHSECTGAQGFQLACKYCSETRGYIEGIHTWGAWQGTGNACTGYTQKRTCAKCGETQSQTVAATGHKWVSYFTAASCTTAGASWLQCTICGAEQNRETIPATGHRARTDDGDCTTPVMCVTCGGIAVPAKEHSYSSTWTHDNVNHWHACTNSGCTARSGEAKHNGTLSNDCTRLSSCSVCGIKSSSSGLSHNFNGAYTRVSSTGHAVMCSNPGCLMSSDNVPHVAATGMNSCTEPVKCACGYTMTAALNNHTYGAWTGSAGGHSRTCTRCGQVETASHTAGKNNGNCTTAVVCTVCSYVIEQAYASHAYGVWYPNSTNTGHIRMCTHYGCSTSQTAAHSGGAATCASPAVCYVCGGAYGSVSSTHSGGTEIRNAKPAEVGVAGYTGDTYCLGCGKLITKGSTIKALEAGHTHSFGTAWKSDSGSHWHECACGEHSGEAAHRFTNGKCSVCGAADPNYRTCGAGGHIGGTEIRHAKSAGVGVTGYTGDTYCLGCGQQIARGITIPALSANHQHVTSSTWTGDSVSHWHECACGEHLDAAKHSFVDGRCSVCGVMDMADAEAHVHIYGAWISNGKDHWRECSVCGVQTDRAEHVMVDDKCVECGAGKKVVTASTFKDITDTDTAFEAVKRVVEAGVIEGASKNEFKPEEWVARGQLADILYRLAGNPEAVIENAFADVTDEDAFSQAVSWVTANSIMEGDGEIFDPERTVTLEELITFLWRYARAAEYADEIDGKKLSDYVDPSEVDLWAADAMVWAYENGLLEGLEEDDLIPVAAVSRATVAVVAAHFMDLVEALEAENS